jgi:hypothetical protein
VDVASGIGQVVVVADEQRVEAAAEDRAVAAEPLVEVARVHRPEAMHEVRQAAVGASDEQVVVVAHQAVRASTDAGALTSLRDELEEPPAVGRDVEDRSPPGAAIHHVMPGAGDVDPVRATHGTMMTSGCIRVP